MRAFWRFKLFIDDEETNFDDFRKTLGLKSHETKGQSPSNLFSDPAERVDSLIDPHHETFDLLSMDKPEEFSCDDLDGYIASINVGWVGNGAGEHTQTEYDTMSPSEALNVNNLLNEICKN